MKTNIKLIYKGTRINGLLNTPAEVDNYPIVIIFNSIMKNKFADDQLFKALSIQLEMNNIASMQFDYYPDGSGRINITEILLQAEATVNYIHTLKNIDKSRIYTIGYSIDSAVASIIAAKCNHMITRICLISPVCRMVDVIQKKFSHSVSLSSQKDGIMIDVGAKMIQELESLDVIEMSKGFLGKFMIVYSEDDNFITRDDIIKYRNIYNKNYSEYIINGTNHSFSNTLYEPRIINTLISFMS